MFSSMIVQILPMSWCHAKASNSHEPIFIIRTRDAPTNRQLVSIGWFSAVHREGPIRCHKARQLNVLFTESSSPFLSFCLLCFGPLLQAAVRCARVSADRRKTWLEAAAWCRLCRSRSGTALGEVCDSRHGWTWRRHGGSVTARYSLILPPDHVVKPAYETESHSTAEWCSWCGSIPVSVLVDQLISSSPFQ